MRPAKISLPYFDIVLDRLSAGDPEVQQVFGRHVHWGYWETPQQADGSLPDFAAAAENLCQRVYRAAQVQNSDRLLDAGCGFGGTIASLNDTFDSLQMVGLNIDPRQLERARQEVHPSHQNQIEFVEGDACQMPFADASFDVVLAVECIFHFPSRSDFFREARRVLRPGGRLALSDFVPSPVFQPLQAVLETIFGSLLNDTYGRVDSHCTLADYQQLAIANGFKLTVQEDITVNTLPTYPVVRHLFERLNQSDSARSTAIVEQISRWGLLRYLVLGFEVN